ncbi:hypothetical protein CH063_13144 [Colletotrichum higginsianum]|uniref:BTB domain-containing protein n=1 Tax=Colletotrichum higginsianum (strain IMI 349063) TaxID=759273 RepID=H1VT82_COLHI|nr:hypothetical protein CH63R_13666 [Colletotrichum higginsianum IMI 349063]OBR02440.1 hypothetical protein CH63R_13666 [Colletotrichum higginsianum IMI 349063]CCF43440.1 hypothetical protein CH063_13144 [Colletotrichum higginsianum]
MSLKRKTSLGDIFQSQTIKFIIGEAGVACYIHETAIANLSDSLQALFRSKKNESTEGSVVWKHLEMDTFTMFMEYAYTQDFTIIDPDQREDISKMSLMTFISMRAPDVAIKYANDYFDKVDDTRESIQHSFEYYMSIARLYNLANQCDLSELMDLCIEKVRLSLANSTFDKNDACSVWMLLESIWPRTNIEDKFREVLLRFILFDLRTAMESAEAVRVLKNTPEISTALLLMAPYSYWVELTSHY